MDYKSNIDKNKERIYEAISNIDPTYAIKVLADTLFRNYPQFEIWTGSGSYNSHHYGKGGLLQHTREVLELCIQNYGYLTSDEPINNFHDLKILVLGALYHDVGKIWDYGPKDGGLNWENTNHKKEIHHVPRSYLEWNRVATELSLSEEVTDEVSHLILSHHGCKEWGSPVEPRNKLAWILHLSDNMSAKFNCPIHIPQK